MLPNEVRTSPARVPALEPVDSPETPVQPTRTDKPTPQQKTDAARQDYADALQARADLAELPPPLRRAEAPEADRVVAQARTRFDEAVKAEIAEKVAWVNQGVPSQYRTPEDRLISQFGSQITQRYAGDAAAQTQVNSSIADYRAQVQADHLIPSYSSNTSATSKLDGINLAGQPRAVVDKVLADPRVEQWAQASSIETGRSYADVMNDLRTFASAGTFGSAGPLIPNDPAIRTSAQEAAAQTLDARAPASGSFGKAGGIPVPGNPQADEFVQQLEQHRGDNGWVRDYLGALGADNTARLLYETVNPATTRRYSSEDIAGNRSTVRSAIGSLQDAGLLTNTDLTQAHFKTTPQSAETYDLATLLQADKVQQQVEQRRTTLEKNPDLAPNDSSVYNAYDAVLTVNNPHNQQQIVDMAKRYGIDPALLAGTVAAEMDFDHDQKDVLQDGVGRLLGGTLGTGPGITSTDTRTVKAAVQYLSDHRLPGADEAVRFLASDPNLSEFDKSVEAAAIVLSAYQNARGPGPNTATDMAVVWGGFRAGVDGLLPEIAGNGYSQDGFRRNQANSGDELAGSVGDPHAAIGGNAYQSEPYFALFQKEFASG